MRTGRPLIAAAFTVAAAGFATVPALAAQGGLEVYPATAVPGSTVTVTTTACGARGTASVDAGAVGPGPFTLSPAPDAARAGGRFAVPVSAQPGTYEIVARCSGGAEVTGDLIVSPAQAGMAGPQMPRGLVRTALGGALGPDPVQIGAGVAALAVAAACGTWLLHRGARGGGL